MRFRSATALFLVLCTVIIAHPALHWTRANISGLILVPKSKLVYSRLHFFGDGSVEVWWSTKERYQWQIDDGGTLLIDSPVDHFERLTLISRSPNEIVAKTSTDGVVTFKIVPKT